MKKTLALLAKISHRELKSNWAQFLAIIGIGGVAVTLFVGLLANAASIENRVNQAYDEGQMADLWVTTSLYKPNDLALIQETVGDLGTVEGRFEAPGRHARNSVYSVITPKMPTISKPYEIEEKSAEQSDTHFVLVDDSLAHPASANMGESLKLGDTFEISYDISSYVNEAMAKEMDQYLLDSKAENPLREDSVRLDYTITGIMRYPENVTKAAYNTSAFLVDDGTFKTAVHSFLASHFNQKGLDFLYLEANSSALRWGDGTSNPAQLTTPNQYLVSLKNHSDSAQLEKRIQAAFAAKTTNNLYNLSNRESMPFVTTMHNDVVQARQFTFVFPFVFFFVAVLVILTTISQIILKERTQIGTLKALGLSNHEIYAHYIGLTMSVVSLGILIGEIIGPILIPYILGKKYDILYTLPARSYVFPLLYGLMTAVFFLGVSALVAYVVCHKEVRLKPAESMRPASPKMKAHETHLDFKKNQASFLSVKMAFRNIKLNLVKSIMVVVGVMGCTALLVCGFGIEDTIDYGKKKDMAMASMDNDSVLSLTFSAPETRSKLDQDLLSYANVESYEPLNRGATTIHLVGDNQPSSNTNIYILGADENNHIGYVSPEKNGISMSDKIARETGAKVNDTIVFSYGSKDYRGVLTEIYRSFIFNGIMLHSSNSLFSSLGEMSFQGAFVNVKKIEGTSDILVAKAVKKEMVEGDKPLSYLIEADTTEDWVNQINDIMSGVLVMTNAVKVFAIILALIVLYNLALLNFRERSRDIATLKVLGFTKREIALSLMWETMTLTFIGVFFGVFLGYPFLLAVLKLNTVQLVQYQYYIYWTSYFFSFLLTFIVAFGVNLYLSFRTGTVKMVESLKSVE